MDRFGWGLALERVEVEEVDKGRYGVVERARRQVACEERVDCVSCLAYKSSLFLAGGSVGDAVDLRLLMTSWRASEKREMMKGTEWVMQAREPGEGNVDATHASRQGEATGDTPLYPAIREWRRQ